MRIAVTGGGGMLATALVPQLRRRGHAITPLTRQDLDVTAESAVRRRIAAERVDVVVHCAAYTAVDRAEEDEAAAYLVNAMGTRYVADACQANGTSFVYLSTDYVFPGTHVRPYLPGDPTDPVNAYGRTKREGEIQAQRSDQALIVRTSWLYGRGGANFVDTIRRLAAERERLEVVDDQIGRPTWTGSLARSLADLIEQEAHGIFHATGGGAPVSWYGFAEEIARLNRLGVELVPVSSSRYSRAAPRPAYSVLDCTATEESLGYRLPDWQKSLADYLSGAGE